MDESSVRHRFAEARTATLATVSAEGLPHLVPVTFALADDQLAFAVDHKPKRTRDLRRLRNITENASVCLLVDHYDEDWNQLWWARADGVAEIMDDATTVALWGRRLADRYDQYVDQLPEGPVVVITVRQWRGWAYSE